jgi:putative intracellular protease/amidase
MRSTLKRCLAFLAGLVLALALVGWAFVHSLDLDALPKPNEAATVADLAFVDASAREPRGRILAVLTSTDRLGDKRTGFELTELSRAYWVFRANGYAVDFASPRGGEPSMVRDEDLVDADHAFLNDRGAMAALATTIALRNVDPGRYAAVYFVGGKGAMFDFPGNADIARIVRAIAPRGVVGAICHGPAALLDLELADGTPLLRGKRATGFTNAEELFLMDDARERFPFLLQDALSAQGASFVEAPMYLDNTVVDGRLVTGQNPWSTWSLAEAMVRALGHAPVAREATPEERSVRLFAEYHARGLDAALALKARSPGSDRRLLLMHAVIAAMQWRLVDAWRLQRLAQA